MVRKSTPSNRKKARPKRVRFGRTEVHDTGLFRHRERTVHMWTRFLELSEKEQARVLREWQQGTISQREFDGLFMFDAALGDLTDPMPKVSDWLDGYEKGAKAHLKDRKLPTNWRVLSKRGIDNFPLTVRKAHGILIDIESARRAIEKNDAELMGNLAFRIAGAFMVMEFTPAEHAVIRGRKVVAAAKQWSKTRKLSTEVVKQIRLAAKDLWRQDPRRSARGVADELSKKFDVSAETIRKRIGDLKPKRPRGR